MLQPHRPPGLRAPFLPSTPFQVSSHLVYNCTGCGPPTAPMAPSETGDAGRAGLAPHSTGPAGGWNLQGIASAPGTALPETQALRTATRQLGLHENNLSFLIWT